MGGLLYKDFISVSGKKLVRTMMFLTVLYSCLRIVFDGPGAKAAFVAENEAGQTVNLLDSFFVISLGIFMIGVLGLMNGWSAKLVESDRKNRLKGYICSLPIEKNTYVASKYIFIAVAAYIFMSLAFVWGIVCNAFCAEGYFAEMVSVISSFIPSLMCLVLLSAAVELPMFLLMGKQKAMLIKIAMLMFLAFVCIGFLFFGDLNGMNENLNITAFMKWCEAHTLLVSLTQMLVPVVTLALYYFSYRAACRFAEKGVAGDE